jgi:penicillin-binding protein 2
LLGRIAELRKLLKVKAVHPMEFSEKETRFAAHRLVLLQWVLVAFFLFLISGFWRLQILDPEYYTLLAERNHVKEISIPAARGRVLDREGRVLVDNYPSFSIVAQWGDFQDLEEHLPGIAAGLGMERDELARRIETARRRAPLRPIILRENASWQDVAFVETHRIEYPGLDLMTVQRRAYLADGFAAHLLGYVGEVSEADMDLPEFALLEPGDRVGKAGIERQYNDLLKGTDGARRIVVNTYGAEVAVLDSTPPTPGRDLRLTLDYDLQAVAEQGFQEDSGALVALSPQTGEVLALVSRPTFDPNLFAGGRISNQDWAGLMSDPNLPLVNRAIQAQLAPGSIFKIVMAAAAIQSGTATEETSFYCPGGANFYGRYFRCWQTRGHGRVSLHQAIVHSCDVFFYNLGRNLGVERIADYSVQFGLGRKTGIDLPHEQTGTVPSPEWKERVFREKWYPGETISLAIGQGALTTTPLQIAYSVGGIATGGYFARPHLIALEELTARGRKVPPGAEVRVALAEETVAAVTDALYGVVNEGGTGGRARIVGLDVGGKTGTAQVASIDASRSAKAAGSPLLDNAWFVGLAPRRNPEIVVAVLYQAGEHGALAAPLARDVIKAYFDKKKGIRPHFTNREEPGPNTTSLLPPARVGG